MTITGRIDAFPDPKGPADGGIIHDVDNLKDVGALAHCVAHKMEDKMGKKKLEKKIKEREGDGGGGDEKTL